MEDTYKDLPPRTREFFDSMKMYIGETLYFYGSVQRIDYFPGASDIDVDVFTSNVESTVAKLAQFLNSSPSNMKKVVWHIPGSPTIIRGTKVTFSSSSLDLVGEVTVFNENVKETVLWEHRVKMTQHWIVLLCLYVVKLLFYKWHLIDGKTYKRWKGSLIKKDNYVAY